MKDFIAPFVAPALILVLAPSLFAQPPAGPNRTFAAQCSICHGGDANGTDRAPGVLAFLRSHSDAELSTLLRSGRPDRGMPKFDFNDSEIQALTAALDASTPVRWAVSATVNSSPVWSSDRGDTF